jgi:hypothetical protein
MPGEDISLPFKRVRRVLLFILVVALLNQNTTAQPASWNDVCAEWVDPVLNTKKTNCYLWTGAPFPFNDIGSFVKRNPFCPITTGTPCNIYVSPVLINCQVTTAVGDNTGPPVGCQFYKPSNATATGTNKPYNVLLCNLPNPCSDRGSDPKTFLAGVWSGFMSNVSVNTNWLTAVSPYAVSSLFGGPGTPPDLNTNYLSSLFGAGGGANPQTLLANPPPTRIRWDGPITITTPLLTIDSMWSVAAQATGAPAGYPAGSTFASIIPSMPLNIQIGSPLQSATTTVNSCTLFNIVVSGVSVRNIVFFVDPACGASPLAGQLASSNTASANTLGTIVYTVPLSSPNGIGVVNLVNLSSVQTPYPLVYILDNYQGAGEEGAGAAATFLSINRVIFNANIDGTRVPPAPPPAGTAIPVPTQTLTPFASVVLQFGGLLSVDTISPGLVFGSRALTVVNTAPGMGASTPPNFIDAFSQITNIDPLLRGCPGPILFNSCDQKRSTDLALVISTSILLGTLVLYALVEICRRRRLTVQFAATESAEKRRQELLGSMGSASL